MMSSKGSPRNSDDSSTDDYSPKKPKDSSAEAKSSGDKQSSSVENKCTGTCDEETNCSFCFFNRRLRSVKRHNKTVDRKTGQSNLTNQPYWSIQIWMGLFSLKWAIGLSWCCRVACNRRLRCAGHTTGLPDDLDALARIRLARRAWDHIKVTRSGHRLTLITQHATFEYVLASS